MSKEGLHNEAAQSPQSAHHEVARFDIEVMPLLPRSFTLLTFALRVYKQGESPIPLGFSLGCVLFEPIDWLSSLPSNH